MRLAPDAVRIDGSIMACDSGSAAVDLARVLQHRIGLHPVPALEAPEKTALATGVARDPTLLLHSQQDHVPVAIQPQFA